VEDEGVAQEIQLDETPDTEPVSLVVAVQRGGSASLEFGQSGDQGAKAQDPLGVMAGHKLHKIQSAPLSGLGTMVEDFLGDTKSEVAVVAFDSEPTLIQDFTEKVPSATKVLHDLKGSGRGGSAVLDAVSYSVGLLEGRPGGRTKVVLLISEPRDHGSHTKLEQVIENVMRSNVLIYSVTFSPLRAETMRDLKGENRDTSGAIGDPVFNRPAAGVDLLGLASKASNALRKNAAEAVADMSGGEYRTFKDKLTFDGSVDAFANHVRNRYLLSFQPKNPKPGPHTITVRLRDSRSDVSVTARNRYWAK